MKYDNIVIGDSIRKLRKSHHMTQMELAEKLDISFTHCSQLKQGCHKMSVDLLFRMMTLFQVDVNTILGIRETEEDRNAKPFSGIQEQIDSLEQGKREHFLNTCKLMLDGFAVKKKVWLDKMRKNRKKKKVSKYSVHCIILLSVGTQESINLIEKRK